MLDEYDEVVDDDDDGLSAEAGREFTSTAESGVSERFPFPPLPLFSSLGEVELALLMDILLVLLKFSMVSNSLIDCSFLFKSDCD